MFFELDLDYGYPLAVRWADTDIGQSRTVVGFQASDGGGT